MKRYVQYILLVLLLLSFGAKGQSGDSTRILFVGNSYTYFWNLPQTVAAMAASQEIPVIIRQTTAGGASLRDHWESEKGLQTRSVIQNGDWDIIILQNHSLSSINKYDEFMEYGKRFISLVKSVGAEPMLYITWAREYNPLMQPEITSAYEKLAKDTEISTIPAGPAWEQVRIARPDLNLFAEDGSHPSPVGTYLTACVTYATLFNMETGPIPERITTPDRNGEKLYLSILSKNNAEFIHQLVDGLLSNKIVSDD